jgi:hypothetical protein
VGWQLCADRPRAFDGEFFTTLDHFDQLLKTCEDLSLNHRAMS